MPNSQINIADVQALIELAIMNNKPALIKVMNDAGYNVAQNISDADLFNAVGKIGDSKGISTMSNLLLKVPLDKTKITQEQAKNLAIKFGNLDPSYKNAKFGDFLNKLGQGIGDFFSGHTVVNQNPNITTQNTEPVLSPTIVTISAVVGIIAIVLLNRGETSKRKVIISIMIGVIILAVVLFGIFAKKQTITQSGGGGSQDVHNGALGWLQGILNGLHLSVAG